MLSWIFGNKNKETYIEEAEEDCDMKDLQQALIGKINELDSLKKYVTDEGSLNIINAKQDTLNDVYDLVNSMWTSKILSIGSDRDY